MGCFPVVAETPENAESQKTAIAAMCGAAASQLMEAGTGQIILMLTLNSKGHVQSFTTESPKGLNLGKMKEAAAKIKAMHFTPPQKNGSSVAVKLSMSVDCSHQAASNSQSQ